MNIVTCKANKGRDFGTLLDPQGGLFSLIALSIVYKLQDCCKSEKLLVEQRLETYAAPEGTLQDDTGRSAGIICLVPTV
jgi:hypothetical protein